MFYETEKVLGKTLKIGETFEYENDLYIIPDVSPYNRIRSFLDKDEIKQALTLDKDLNEFVTRFTKFMESPQFTKASELLKEKENFLKLTQTISEERLKLIKVAEIVDWINKSIEEINSLDPWSPAVRLKDGRRLFHQNLYVCPVHVTFRNTFSG